MAMTPEQAKAAAAARLRLKQKNQGLAPEGTDDLGILQQLFDVKNASTGESYIYGNRPKPTVLEDIMRIGTDTASRGYVDKLNNTAHLTAAARERQPDIPEAALDIGTSIVTSPYRVAGMAGGAIAGGLEGAASAYGHQKDWTPDLWNIAKEAGKGALLGGGGAKAGEWLGKIGSKFGKQPKIQTEEDLLTAAERGQKRAGKGGTISPRTEDIIARNKRMDAARMANAEGPEGFDKLLKSMDQSQWPINERELLAKLANPQNLAGRFTEGVGRTMRKLGPYGVVPFAGTGIAAAGGGINALSKGGPDLAALKESILDVTGKFAETAKKAEAGRDTLSKALVGAEKDKGKKKKKK